MKKTILALAAAGLLPLAGFAAEEEPVSPPPSPAGPSAPGGTTAAPGKTTPSPGSTTPAPTRFEPKTTYGDIARVLSAQPVFERTPSGRRECRMENTGYNSAATEVPRCDDKGSGERIVAYDVTYQYMGRDFRIRLPYQPGEQIAVNVEVRPPMPQPARGNRPSQYRGPY